MSTRLFLPTVGARPLFTCCVSQPLDAGVMKVAIVKERSTRGSPASRRDTKVDKTLVAVSSCQKTATMPTPLVEPDEKSVSGSAGERKPSATPEGDTRYHLTTQEGCALASAAGGWKMPFFDKSNGNPDAIRRSKNFLIPHLDDMQ